MDYSAALKSEIAGPAVTLLAPGVIALTPYVFILLHYYPEIYVAGISHVTLTAVLGFLVSTGFGLLAQELGTRIEAFVIDPILIKKDSAHKDNWYKYLRCTFPDNLVARSYIESLVLHLKFELNTASALILGWVGLLWLMTMSVVVDVSSFFIVTGCVFAGVIYLVFEAVGTGQVLGRVRAELLKGVGNPPIT